MSKVEQYVLELAVAVGLVLVILFLIANFAEVVLLAALTMAFAVLWRHTWFHEPIVQVITAISDFITGVFR